MHRQMNMVKEFHRKFGLPIGDTIAFRTPELRAKLIEEEAKETADAIRAGNMAEAVDGCIDVLYVVLGALVSFGVEPGPVFEEVHATNMAKEGGGTREDGKILKPKGWKAPRIQLMLDRQMYRPGLYAHYKGGHYELVDIITNTSSSTGYDQASMVLYRQVDDGTPKSFFTRILEEFVETVDWPDGTKGPRFKYTGPAR